MALSATSPLPTRFPRLPSSRPPPNLTPSTIASAISSATNHQHQYLCPPADAEVAVQIFPCWPYDVRSQMLKGRAVGHVGPPDFRFYLPRDGDAFRFWLERDKALPDFWDDQVRAARGLLLQRLGGWGVVISSPTKPNPMRGRNDVVPRC